MPLPLLPLAVVGLAGGAWWMKKHRRGMTPERQIVYETALLSLKDPVKLRALAAAFEKEGMKDQAALLLKRATLRELPADVKAARREAFRKGMAATDPAAVNALAEAFYKEGATGAAESLRKYAVALTTKPAQPPAQPQGPMPPMPAPEHEHAPAPAE